MQAGLICGGFVGGLGVDSGFVWVESVVLTMGPRRTMTLSPSMELSRVMGVMFILRVPQVTTGQSMNWWSVSYTVANIIGPHFQAMHRCCSLVVVCFHG